MTDVIPDLADGYAPRGSLELERAQYVDWSVKTGNGSMYSTAEDLVRFTRALHAPGLLSDEMRKLAYTRHSANAGYGWFLSEANGKQIHQINGRSPGWAAQLDHYVADDVTVVVLSNVYSSVTTPIARAVGALHFGEVPATMPALRAEPLTPAKAMRLVGSYRFGADYYVPNSTVTITEKNGYIQAEYPSDYPASAYIPVTDTQFIVRPFWMPAEFILGADGKASELVLDGFKGKRE
jgi:CubicO group peptidase (beta-lactamase class C family)